MREPNQSKNELSRRDFLGAVGKIGGASAVLGVMGTLGVFPSPAANASTSAGSEAVPSGSPAIGSSYVLRNVRLESGYVYEGTQVTSTSTIIRHLHIEQGVIAAIHSNAAKLPVNIPHYDAKKLLMLPAFKEMHIHLDKTFYGGPWRAVRPTTRGIFDRIAEEQVLLPQLLPTAQERAEKLIQLILGYGSTYVRSHCNIDPVVGTSNLEHLQKALHNYRDKIRHEIVAFPQHGLLLSNIESTMREAMRMGCTHVGGLDPTNVDGDMERSLQTMVQIAVDFKAGIDIHLHEGGETGLKAIRRLIDLTEQAALQGKVTVSHAFSLASLPAGEDEALFSKMASLGMSVASSVPIGRGVMPIPLMRKLGVNVILGNDSITDHWSPFGIGDVLQKAHLAAQLYGWSSEYNLSRALSLATGGIMPLSERGKRIWPRAGDEATGVLVEASCSAEAVARLSRRAATLYQGRVVSGTIQASATQ
ncbi:amidohydrolase [Paenibacillus sp. GCM10023252]|uniref:amidohydrolase family protein n=1 Tax=Paenibacillus sp. GCM10023252 TaxID=3252649 RepID=UPI0036061B3F